MHTKTLLAAVLALLSQSACTFNGQAFARGMSEGMSNMRQASYYRAPTTTNCNTMGSYTTCTSY